MRTSLFAAGLFFFVGCFYPAERGKALEAKVDELSQRNAQLQHKLDSTVPKVDEKIAEVEKALDGLDKASRSTDADIGVQLQRTVEDLAQLRGQVETYLHKINELETKLQASESAVATAKGGDGAREADAKRKAEELKRPEDKREFLLLADGKAKGGEIAVARQLYAEFMKKWPKDALIGEAHFGLGETYFGEDKCREALFEYGKVIQEHPKTKAAPVAYLRSADCFKKLKMLDESRLALEELSKQYPKSDAARQAKTRLVELDKDKRKVPAPAPKKKGAP